MDAVPTPDPPAPRPPWWPLTVSQVVALVHASWGRLFLLTTLTALLVAGVLARVASTAWLPVVDRAITRLPATGEIREGRLRSPAAEWQMLAANGFLAVVLNPTNAVVNDVAADLQIELRGTGARLTWLGGSGTVPYPPGVVWPVNRTELGPMWGAWRPHLFAGFGLGVLLALEFVWLLLGMAAALLLRTVAALAGRGATFGACWRVGIAACLPCALPVAIGIGLYGHRGFAHGEPLLLACVPAFLYPVLILLAAFRLPAHPTVSPFATQTSAANHNPRGAGHAAPRSPFAPAEPETSDAPPQGSPPPQPSAAPPPRPNADEIDPLNPS